LANTLKITVNGLTLLAFTAFLIRLVNLRYALICTLTWLSFIEVSHGYYSAFHGLLLMMNLQMGILFLSLWWYLGLIEKGRQGFQLSGPYLLLGLVFLAYEPMLFLSASYFAVSLFKRKLVASNSLDNATLLAKYKSLVSWTIDWIRANWMLFVVIFAYMATYFIYRFFQPTPGRWIDNSGNLDEIIKTIYRFSVYGFNFEFNPISRFEIGVTPILTQVSSISYGICLAFVAYLILPTTGSDIKESIIRSPVALAIIAYFVFSPNLLLALTEGFRKWAAESPYYVGNYLSSFALAILIANGIIAVIGGSKTKQEPILFALVVFWFASSGIGNITQWSNFADTNRRDAKLWSQAIIDLRNSIHSLPQIPITVCGKNAPEKVSGDDIFWSWQLSRELGKEINFRSKRLNSGICDVIIDFNRYRDNPK